MKINANQLNKLINIALFVAAFFLQAYVDGKYIAYGEEPTALKLIKYALIACGILFGFLQLLQRKSFIFLKEMRNVLCAIGTFLLVSLILLLVRGGDMAFCLELIMRYTMSIVYAFVILNLFTFEDIYNVMVYFLIVSIFGWILQIGDILLDITQYSHISFLTSYSPFESHYFAPSAMNCCAFFLYYKRNKWTQIVSFIFALMTFKRVQLVFAIAILIIPLFVDPNRQLKKRTIVLFCVGIILMTLGYFAVLQPENEWIVEKVTGQTADEFTGGRSVLLMTVLNSDYVMSGLGTTEAILGRGIEMELISIMLEMSFPVMVLFVFCYVSVAGHKLYSLLVMAYLMVLLMTGSGLYNVFLWTIAFMFFGSVNYVRTEDFKPARKGRLKLRWKE